jgi:glycogen operon protein
MQRLIALRKEHPTFMRRRWFQGRPLHGAGIEDIAWLTPGGTPMTDEDWSAGFAKSLMVFLNGSAIAGIGPRGERIEDDSFLLLFNAHEEPVEFTLEGVDGDRSWRVRVDTKSTQPPAEPVVKKGDRVTVEGRSIVVLSDVSDRARQDPHSVARRKPD